jgi:hypothetical protein
LASVVPGTVSTAIFSGLSVHCGQQIRRDHLRLIGPGGGRAGGRNTQGSHRLAVEVWNKRMLGFQGPAQPSPALGDALNAGYLYLEVKCLGCTTHQTVTLDVVRRPKTTPVHELERYMRCRDCSEVRGCPYKRSHLVALRPNKTSAGDPPSTWWPGER